MILNSYHRSEWFAYREKCLEQADFCCQRCGKEGVLQVHHPEYVSGRLPWQYPIEHCQVLCRGCHAERHGKIPPSSGWFVLDSDLERNEPSDEQPCEYCRTTIRWHFEIYHPEWGSLIVGSECAENLSLGEEIKALRSYSRRLTKFIDSKRWKRNEFGWVIKQKTYRVLIRKYQEGHRIKIDHRRGDLYFETLKLAKIKAFEIVEYRCKKKDTGHQSCN